MKIVSENLPIFIFITLFFFQTLFSEIRDIFAYDPEWKHAEYTIIAHGHMDDTGKTFKVLQCCSESKIIFEK